MILYCIIIVIIVLKFISNKISETLLNSTYAFRLNAFSHNYLFYNRVPHFYFINLSRSKTRLNKLTDSFRKYNHTNYKRINAIDGKDSNILYKTLKSRPINCLQNDLELACLSSHLSAILQAYNDGLEEVFICEDDLIIDYFFKNVDKFYKLFMNKPMDAEIIQLLCLNNIIYDKIFIKNLKNKKNKKNNFKTWNRLHWGCQIYYINRSGMKKIIDKYFPDFKNSSNMITLPENYNEDLHEFYTADYLVYNSCKTYTMQFPFFNFTNIQSNINQDTVEEFQTPSHKKILEIQEKFNPIE